MLAELYLPLPQSVHPEAVLEGAYLPALQVEQILSAAFCLLYFPFVQAMHWVAPLLLFVRYPWPQVEQVVSAAFWLLYVPGPHAMHWVAALLLFVRYPWPQVVQAYTELALAELYLPLPQSAHPEAAAEEANFPGPQALQPDLPC